jgi:AcrR family transcriptional regulator
MGATSRKIDETRWGSRTRAETSAARTRLLDAAIFCYERLGVGKTSMADIAAQAKVTRPTVYRYFSSHRDILDAVVRRQIDRFWEQLHRELQGIDSFGEYLVECLLYTLRYARRTDVHQFLFAPDILPLTHEIFLADRDYLIDLSESMRPIYERMNKRDAVRPEADLLMLCELFNRLAVSYLLTPSPLYSSEAKLRELFRAMIAPLENPR